MPDQRLPDEKSPTRGLTASRNPAQRMQELLRKPVTALAADDETSSLLASSATDQPSSLEVQTSAAEETPPAKKDDHTNDNSEDDTSYLNTQISNQVSNDALNETVKGLSTQGNGEVRTRVRAPASKSVPKREIEQPAVLDAHAGVRTRLQSQSGKEANVRLSVDVSETLHMRIKQYCAMHRIPSSRMLIIALLEDYLEGEGF